MPGTSTSLGTFSPRAMEPSLTWRFICWHQAYLNKAAFFQQVQTPLGLAVEAFRISVLLLISLGRIKTSPVKRTYRPSCLHRPTRSPKASVLVSNSPDTPVSSCLPGCSVLARQDPDPGVVTEFHLLSSVSLFVIPSVDSNLEVPDQGFLYQNFQLLIPNLRHQIKVFLPCWLTPNK